MHAEARMIHVKVETREGIVLYEDDAGQMNRRALCTLTLAILLTDKVDQTEVCWRTTGSTIGLIPQMIAEYYVRNPGLRDAVEGLYILTRTIRHQHPHGGSPA